MQMQFIDKGGNVVILLGEGGEAKFGTNINFLLEEYGIMINPDAVCRFHAAQSPMNLPTTLYCLHTFMSTFVFPLSIFWLLHRSAY